MTPPTKISARELRIGNIHQSEDFAVPRMGISSVKIDGKSFSYITGHGIALVESGEMDFIPIPLTEEWLIKFEFCFYEENNSWQLDTQFGFSIWGRIDSGLSVYVGSDECGVSIKYVHQLQNLIFCLSGEELKIK